MTASIERLAEIPIEDVVRAAKRYIPNPTYSGEIGSVRFLGSHRVGVGEFLEKGLEGMAQSLSTRMDTYVRAEMTSGFADVPMRELFEVVATSKMGRS